VNPIQVVIFSSAKTLYGVMSSQIAGLYRASDEPSAEDILDLVELLEGAGMGRQAGTADTDHRTGKELVIRGHRGMRYRVPGPAELTELRLDDFQLIPSTVLRHSQSRAIRAAFAHGDLIGLLLDLDRVTVLS
jgi:hypothetical protein